MRWNEFNWNWTTSCPGNRITQCGKLLREGPVQRELRSESSTTSLSWGPANTTAAIAVTLFFLVFLGLYFFLTGQPAL